MSNGYAGVSDEMAQMPGFKRGVPLENNHRGGTLENSEYLMPKENVQKGELECLKRVFDWMDTSNDRKISWQEISEVLVKLNHKTPRDKIELWIWEVDDDLDGMVGEDEFLTMYQRCISDTTGNEPRNLFNLVQFLMYDKEFTGRISVEQTLQILYVRHGRDKLDFEIQEIFGDPAAQKGPDGQELKISFTQFYERANARLTKLRSRKKEVTKVAITTRKR